MAALLITLHIIVCIALIMIVLLQTGKGSDMGAAFGGGGSQTLFGSTGASTFLSTATTWAAIIFMFTCLTLAYVSSHKTGTSIMKDVKVPAAEQAQTETVPAAEKTEAESASPVQTAVETKAAGEEVAADTKKVPAEAADAKEVPAEAVPSAPAPAAAPEISGDKPASPEPSVPEENKTEQNKSN